MKNLKGSRAYLVGPMDRVPDHGVGWRRDITPFLENLGIHVLDPTNKPILKEALPGVAKEEREKKDFYRKSQNWDGLTSFMKAIRNVDLRMTDICDFLIVHLIMEAQMCGTWEEIFNANRQKKPILCVIDGGPAAMPDWMFGVLPYKYFFGSFESMKAYLEGLSVGTIPFDDRWTLLDYSRMDL